MGNLGEKLTREFWKKKYFWLGFAFGFGFGLGLIIIEAKA
jgi:hypothetical protein